MSEQLFFRFDKRRNMKALGYWSGSKKRTINTLLAQYFCFYISLPPVYSVVLCLVSLYLTVHPSFKRTKNSNESSKTKERGKLSRSFAFAPRSTHAKWVHPSCANPRFSHIAHEISFTNTISIPSFAGFFFFGSLYLMCTDSEQSSRQAERARKKRGIWDRGGGELGKNSPTLLLLWQERCIRVGNSFVVRKRAPEMKKGWEHGCDGCS